MKKTRTTSTNKTQAALRLELFERMFHALPVGVLACSTTGINTYANAEAVRLLGCDFADPLPAADLVASFDLRTAGRDEPYPSEHFPVSRALAGERHRVDDVIAVVNGEPIPLEVRGVPLWSEVDGVTDALAVLVDIRTRGQSAADLRNLEACWHALSAALPEIGFILDEDGRYLEVVASRENLLYAEAARVQNRLLHEVFPKAEADLFLSYVRRTLEAGALQEVEYELDVPKGRRWFEARLAPVQQPIEGRRAVVMVARDITERHQAETAFRQSEQKYRSLFEESKDGVYFSSSDGRLLDINPAGVELFGYDTREELLHVDVAETLYAAPDERNAFVEAMERDGHVRDYEIRSKTKSGEKLVLLVTSSAEYDEHGQIRGYRGIIRDITEKKRLERQLAHAQRMEAVGTLAGGIAHEFNNFLAAMIGYIELLRLDLEEGGRPRQNLEEIYRAAIRARELVEQILTFSRKQESRVVQVELEGVIREILRFMRASLPPNIRIVTDFGEDTGSVMADVVQIHQLVMNLLTNAYHAMREDGGELTITLQAISIDENGIVDGAQLPPGEYLRLTISDTGHGMDEQTLEQIFDPFFTTKPVGEGTGMGLSVAHGIVKAHGGDITAYSRPGAGATFTIYLPRMEGSPVRKSRRRETPLHGSEHILFIDDQEMIVEMGKKLLQNFGYRVTATTDPESALQRFTDSPDAFDLVITDLSMPALNGRELAEKLQKIQRKPIILMTGFREENLLDTSAAFNIRAILPKPFAALELSKTIRQVLDEKQEIEHHG